MQAIFGSLWSNEEKYPHTDRKCAYRSEKLEITQVELNCCSWLKIDFPERGQGDPGCARGVQAECWAGREVPAVHSIPSAKGDVSLIV